ncbi:MAG TPA: acetylornithine deacetylase [Propioniciclava tarda]|nr:acetylornithine deacetylase [Propioniciclava tarda]HQA31428.1 acetylornithine deacetylase [Propioniciclava tarda]
MAHPSAETRTWLSRLVAYDTTSRESNLPLIEDVAAAARGLGAIVNVFPTPDGRKANLVVTVPDASGGVRGGVLLSGHSDCVPVDGQAWTSDPFEVVERDGRLIGRGTADMKGFLACCLAALPAMLERPLREPLHIGLSYDEEVGCVGAPPFVASVHEAGLSPRLGFVGEPSMMAMIRGHKSINLVHVTLTGVPAHSSLTHSGVNAIEYAAEIVRYWRGRADAWKAHGPFDDAYPLPYTSASVNMIAGGNGVNIVPETCRITLEFRALPSVEDAVVLDELRDFCSALEQRMKAENAASSVVMEVAASTVGLDVPADAEVVQLGVALGLESTPDKVTYGTEAGVYTAGGIPCVVCGPGDIGDAHRPDESIALDQLAECEAFLARLIDELRV